MKAGEVARQARHMTGLDPGGTLREAHGRLDVSRAGSLNCPIPRLTSAPQSSGSPPRPRGHIDVPHPRHRRLATRRKRVRFGWRSTRRPVDASARPLGRSWRLWVGNRISHVAHPTWRQGSKGLLPRRASTGPGRLTTTWTPLEGSRTQGAAPAHRERDTSPTKPPTEARQPT